MDKDSGERVAVLVDCDNTKPETLGQPFQNCSSKGD